MFEGNIALHDIDQLLQINTKYNTSLKNEQLPHIVLIYNVCDKNEYVPAN